LVDVCSELYDNSLNGTIPATLGNLSKLISLDLYENQLTGEIPVTLGAIGTLRFLYVFLIKISNAFHQTLS
jgi:hypothetical protein